MDLIDQGLLTHVVNDLSAAGTIDLAGTSAIGSLGRLRAECRRAKERLSTESVTALVAELPGHRSDVRLNRNELDDVIGEPLREFTSVAAGRENAADRAPAISWRSPPPAVAHESPRSRQRCPNTCACP